METRQMILNDIRILMGHLWELTTIDANDHQSADLWRARYSLVDTVSTLSGLSYEDVLETLGDNRISSQGLHG